MTKITITKEAMTKLEALTKTPGSGTMTDYLVGQLRMDWDSDQSLLSQVTSWHNQRRIAADRIEALTAERDAAYARGYSDAETEISKSALGQKVDFLSAEYANAVDRIKDLNELLDEALAEWSKYASAWMTAEGKLEDAVQGLEKCQEELDAYSRQEYPLDHTVHERYRQRDYDANPARITLAALKGERHE